MTKLSPAHLWTMRVGFAALAFAILFFQLLPIGTGPRSWAGADLLLAFALAWSARCPDYVPTLLLATIFFLADLLLQRPPGLMALLALLASESLKAQSHSLRDEGIMAEILTAAALIIAVGIGNRLILAILLVDLPPLGLTAMQIGATVLAYPIIAFLTHALIGVRGAAPGDLQTGGNRA